MIVKISITNLSLSRSHFRYKFAVWFYIFGLIITIKEKSIKFTFIDKWLKQLTVCFKISNQPIKRNNITPTLNEIYGKT